jgi:hypothetical protein
MTLLQAYLCLWALLYGLLDELEQLVQRFLLPARRVDLQIKILYATTDSRCYQLLLKGLSHEIDFDNVDENWQMLAIKRARLAFEFFSGTSDFQLK